MNELELEALCKVYDTVELACRFHRLRDQMNATLHDGDVRFSPLTIRLDAAFLELQSLIEPYGLRTNPSYKEVTHA